MAESPLMQEPDRYTYDQAAEFLRNYFQELELKHGELKKWAEKHKIRYYVLSAFLAGTAPERFPDFVKKIFTAIGYDVEVEREIFYKVRKKL